MQSKQIKNIDGIGRKVIKPAATKILVRTVRPAVPKPSVQYRPANKPMLRERVSWFKAAVRQLYYRRYQVGLFAMIFILLVGFTSGMWVALNTQRSLAEDYEPEAPPGQVKIYSPQELSALGPLQTVSNDVLFNLPIGQLEQYLEDSGKPTPEQQKIALENERAEKLKAYLQEKKSPFADYTDVLARQSHWKLLLAISFAESTFGKNCVNFNCSNIGVKPGHPYWHKYANYGEWMKDFNKLLDKRYSDWTLEQMNGVYVKPKNPNWLMATKQVLDELQERNIQ